MSSYQLISKPIVVDERMKRMIAGAIAEIDQEQIAISRKLTPAQRVRQAIGMIKAGERVAVYRLRQQKPHLSETQALLEVRKRVRELKERSQKWRIKI